MKAMTITAYGENAKFDAAELPKPTVTPGHVVIRIAASSVNTVDTMIRSMGSDLPLSPALPAVLGMDFAGVVDAVGEGVTKFAVGDEVYGCAGGLADLQGALAEYMLADAALIAHKPKSISMREAAAMPLVGITAYEVWNAQVSRQAKRFWFRAAQVALVTLPCSWPNILVQMSLERARAKTRWTSSRVTARPRSILPSKRSPITSPRTRAARALIWSLTRLAVPI